MKFMIEDNIDLCFSTLIDLTKEPLFDYSYFSKIDKLYLKEFVDKLSSVQIKTLIENISNEKIALSMFNIEDLYVNYKKTLNELSKELLILEISNKLNIFKLFNPQQIEDLFVGKQDSEESVIKMTSEMFMNDENDNISIAYLNMLRSSKYLESSKEGNYNILVIKMLDSLKRYKKPNKKFILFLFDQLFNYLKTSNSLVKKKFCFRIGAVLDEIFWNKDLLFLFNNYLKENVFDLTLYVPSTMFERRNKYNNFYENISIKTLRENRIVVLNQNDIAFDDELTKLNDYENLRLDIFSRENNLTRKEVDVYLSETIAFEINSDGFFTSDIVENLELKFLT